LAAVAADGASTTADNSSTTKLVSPLAGFDQGVVRLTDLTIAASLGVTVRIKLSVPALGDIAPVYVNVAMAAQCPAGATAVVTAQENTVCQACVRGEYENAGQCSVCPTQQVNCKDGSTISDWKLKAGYWRSDENSSDVHKCRFGTISCPGDGSNQASMYSPSQRRASSSGATTGLNPYCSPNHIGHLCAACAPDHFLSWTEDGKCHPCATKESHAPTIGLMSGVFVFVLSCLTCAYKKSLGKAHRTTIVTPKPENSLFLKAKQVYILAKFKAFTLLLTSQVRLRSQPSSLINHRHRS
jgi:hypothetical protein